MQTNTIHPSPAVHNRSSRWSEFRSWRLNGARESLEESGEGTDQEEGCSSGGDQGSGTALGGNLRGNGRGRGTRAGGGRAGRRSAVDRGLGRAGDESGGRVERVGGGSGLGRLSRGLSLSRSLSGRGDGRVRRQGTVGLVERGALLERRTLSAADGALADVVGAEVAGVARSFRYANVSMSTSFLQPTRLMGWRVVQGRMMKKEKKRTTRFDRETYIQDRGTCSRSLLRRG